MSAIRRAEAHHHVSIDATGREFIESCPDLTGVDDFDVAQLLIDREQLRLEGGVHWSIVDPQAEVVIGALGQPTRPSRLLCGSETDWVTVTSNREVFDEYDSLGLACPGCVEWVHA
ncbi:MAG: hypothetical protein F2667_14170 [Actinobacteria bacterium]|uniref:Unannotated protein n=1 Tax=freshwater metagenome TaxID=449393 RepID=A0A6J6SEV4_9ZZZZ|nr:hypothetical protein [Actinomycetota bacterium]